MWRFKPFMPKEQTGLEGRTIDVGNLKVHVRNAIAEGGFSCVYLARDVLHGSKQYALKHIIVNDEESLDLVLKEISVMKSLKGHPNIVTLHAHAILDVGRTKEALLVMEYCDQSLVSVLENRGAGFFEEKQVLLIFRDVCNAVFAMHCQSPPIAHRDLKAENLLLGADGLWKLCDFGSTSTNHKRFEKPEEMGIEEDNIRKHTTPAYRAPEMWDLYRRELINEKVDIWALGCLLFRICYFKSAFDGESKLQVLNGNYRIPELPKYRASIIDLIRDMLQSSPDARPDITQVWFRANGLLPDELQKSLPDRPPEMQKQGIDAHEGFSRAAGKTSPMPSRNPPPPPSAAESNPNASLASHNSKAGVATGPIGAFWNTQHATSASVSEETTRPKFDEEIRHSSSSYDKSHPNKVPVSYKTSPSKEESLSSHPVQNNMQPKPANRAGETSSKDFEINLFQDDSGLNVGSNKSSKLEGPTGSQGEAYNAFVAEFCTNKPNPGNNAKQPEKKELMEAEVEKLKQQLSLANMEKSEIASKYEKLSAICRSQRQEIQELKQALAARTPSPSRDTTRNQPSPGSQPSSTPPKKNNIGGTVWELQQGLFGQSHVSPDSKPWQAFADDDPKQQATPVNANPRSVRTRNGHQNRETSETNTSAFGTDSFRAVPVSSSQMMATFNESKNSQRYGELKNTDSKSATQPAGWAGF
ncbi:putative serine/threonine-protein kinase DDB [Capsicum chacoense]